ncbi:mycofactocin biosynthesis peptidyl-dipeptidase MftE [Rhodococcus sp. 06-470-2]|uniref:mycofactocin biosynthesis peptidyl-dipeptidase MftE n=1 Tax=unclassified Rhodococcus (in: high G+C Gram-positive bacteria) TaxID=192944 RepID=UPI000B9BE84A|nr:MULTISPECIES: mycofactocin biosynthesis peptidyl-dipeptidase MftE [unclassified Rhodococcus (in: high G+C Gram-positive bacteria)]OZC56475.1 mycofactocin biosynthesis peptidyl-dipeptidase MftE [Rhodococcus sp. 06-470-2]OZE53994.1 mycofactocin biosynthesis peptidyl-dipeptidase MftE [Rhodococcus sp. 05-2221-1B]
MSRDSLGAQYWPDVDRSRTLVVPVGSIEQHGPHLPLDTDTRIADAVARTVPHATVAPPIAYGASGEHEGFPGTVSIGAAALETLLVEYGRSACRWAERVVFVNGHGGNAPTVRTAVLQLRYEGRNVVWFPCAIPGADAHAGRTETSLLLHLSPEAVDMTKAQVGNVTDIAALLPALRDGGLAPITANGVLGDPTGADAEEGRRAFEQMCTRAAHAVGRWSPSEQGVIS